MTEITRPDAREGLSAARPEFLTGLRAAADAAALADAARMDESARMRAWLETAHTPETVVAGLTLVQWSILLPEGGGWEGLDLSTGELADFSAFLSPRGGGALFDHGTMAASGVEMLLAAHTKAERDRAHAVLALHAVRVEPKERAADDPVLALAFLEWSAGREAVATALLGARPNLGDWPFQRLRQEFSSSAKASEPELFDELIEASSRIELEQDKAAEKEESFGEAAKAKRAPRSVEAPAPAPGAAPPPARARAQAPAPDVLRRSSPADAPATAAGTVLFNPPERMKVGRMDRIEVRLGDAATSVEALREKLQGTGRAQVEAIEIAPRMRVKLMGDPEDFELRALSTDDQFLRPGQPARWDFNVTPKRDGRRILRLLVSIRAQVEGKDEVIDLPAMEREIEVDVAPMFTAMRFVEKHWQWFVTALILPFLFWLAGILGVYDAVKKLLGFG